MSSSDKRVGRIAALSIVNALIFQEVLASQKVTLVGSRRIRPIREVLSSVDPISELVDEWDYIINHIDYVPIFRLARSVLVKLPNNAGLVTAVRRLSKTALIVTSNRALLRHDLMGRIYHRLLADAKYFGAFYTTIPSATLLLKLTLSPNRWSIDWSSIEEIERLRIADLACGTATLLKSALQIIEDNYVKACVNQNKKLDLPGLHKALVEKSLIGLDVLVFAVHLSASTLALHEPDVPFTDMKLYRTFLGGPAHQLGSLEMEPDGRMRNQTLLLGDAGVDRVTPTGQQAAEAIIPQLDLGVMNPPFTRSVGGNLLFGSLPSAERKPLQKKLQNKIRREKTRSQRNRGPRFSVCRTSRRKNKEERSYISGSTQGSPIRDCMATYKTSFVR